MGQRHVCTFRLAQRAAYRTAISAAQTCSFCFGIDLGLGLDGAGFVNITAII